MNKGNRLERALALHLQYREQGGDWQALLSAHPDLADLLQAFRDEEQDVAGGAAPTGSTASGGAGLSKVDDYRLDREIGRGGNGTVYAATDLRLGRTVAVKILHADYAGQPTAVARFLREAQVLARLDHPGIVKVLGVGCEEGRPWLAMEHVRGLSLAQRIEELRRRGGHTGDSLRQLVVAIGDIAAALAHAHRAGIVHRDVKPSNVLLREDGRAVLTDFGIARDQRDPALTQTGVVVGSPHYLAPEQLGADATGGPSADIYSLGATLYECITLTRAFDGPNAQAVIHAVLTTDPVDPRRLQRTLPPDLVAIVGKALEKEPAHRYPTAEALAADLRAFLELREVSARATTRLTRWFRRARRNPLLGAAAALSAVLLAVLLWLGLQWPGLVAARQAARDRDYDAAIAAGFADRGDSDRHFLRALEIDADRPEAIVGLLMQAYSRGDTAAALAELDRRAGRTTDPTLQRCRAWLLRDLGDVEAAASIEAGLPPPRTSLDLWVRALFLMGSPPTPPAARAEALASISLAVRTSPKAHLALQIYWTRLANIAGDKEQRLEAAEALLRQWPDDPVALTVAGEALMQYDPKRAIATLRRAQERGARDPRGMVSLGFAQIIAGEREDGIDTLRRAFAQPLLAVEPRQSVLLMLERLRPEAAAELAASWVRDAPDCAAAHRFAGRAAARAGDARTALAHLEAAVALRPDDVDLRLDRIVVISANGDAERQRDELLALAASHPAHAEVHRQLVATLQAIGPHAALLDELRRWSRISPDNVSAWRDLAAALLAERDPALVPEAIDAAERADYLARGQDAAVLELRAAAMAALGNDAEAERLRRRAAALAPGG